MSFDGLAVVRFNSSGRRWVPAAVIIIVSLWLAAVPASAGPGDLIWVFQGIENVVAMTATADIDGDQVADFAVETYDSGAVGDHLYLLSGASQGTADVIWSIKPPGGPSNSGGYGDDCLNLGTDMSGDGIVDLLLGTAWGGRTAYGIDVVDGSVIWSFDTYAMSPPVPPESGWVYTIHPIPDLNGNMVDDAIFAAGSNNDGAYAVDGLTGEVIYRLTATDAVVSSATLGDVDGDGLAEAVFGGGDNEHRVFCVKGLSQGGAILQWSRNVGSGTWHMSLLEDVDGDGVPEVLVGTFSSGEVWCLSGASGVPVWIYPVGFVVMRVVAIDDVDGDGQEDVAVASWDNGARVISGADGSFIWRAQAAGDVWAIDRAEDVTGDGISEVVAGAFDTRIYLLDGVTGDAIWTYATGNRLLTVRGVGDLSGNGIPDVVGGTQYLSGGGGRVYALEGNASTGIATPAVVGRAIAGAVELGWPTDALPAGTLYHVDRRLFDAAAGARAVGEKQTLASAPLAQRERLEIAAALATPSPFERLTDAPITADGGWGRFVDTSAVAGQTYVYRVAYLRPGLGIEEYLDEVTVSVGADASPLAIRGVGPAGRPHAFRVGLPAATSDYRVAIYGIDGRRLRTVAEGRAAAGTEVFEVAWDGRSAAGQLLASGVYVAEVVAGEARATAKFLWVR